MWQQKIGRMSPKNFVLYNAIISNKKPMLHFLSGGMSKRDVGGNYRYERRTKLYQKKFVFDEDQTRYAEFINLPKILANYYNGKYSDMIEYREKMPNGEIRLLRLTLKVFPVPRSTEIEAFYLFEDVDSLLS